MNRREREELVMRLLGSALGVDRNRKRSNQKPGEVIQRMTAEEREKLSELTAADFQPNYKLLVL